MKYAAFISLAVVLAGGYWIYASDVTTAQNYEVSKISTTKASKKPVLDSDLVDEQASLVQQKQTVQPETKAELSQENQLSKEEVLDYFDNRFSKLSAGSATELSATENLNELNQSLQEIEKIASSTQGKFDSSKNNIDVEIATLRELPELPDKREKPARYQDPRESGNLDVLSTITGLDKTQIENMLESSGN